MSRILRRTGCITASPTSIRCLPHPSYRVFGTSGFLVFHSLLLALCVAAGYSFLVARGSRPAAAAAFAAVFIFASIAPVYFFWLTPGGFFNLTLVFVGVFLWAYKLAAIHEADGSRPVSSASFRSPASDYAGGGDLRSRPPSRSRRTSPRRCRSSSSRSCNGESRRTLLPGRLLFTAHGCRAVPRQHGGNRRAELSGRRSQDLLQFHRVSRSPTPGRRSRTVDSG